MESLYQEIITLWEKAKVAMVDKKNPLHPTPVFDNDTDPFQELYTQLNEIVEKQHNFSNAEFEEMMTPFLSQLREAMGINFTLGGFIEYVLATPMPCCGCFVDNPIKDQIAAEFDKQGEKIPTMPFILFLQCISCGTCNNLRNKHKVCFKFNPSATEENSCQDCGFYKYEHNSCGSFETDISNIKQCTHCRKDRKNHIEMLHLTCCGKDFDNDGYNFCRNCLHSSTDHLYQPAFFYLEAIEQLTLNLKINMFMGSIVNQTNQQDIDMYLQLINELYIPEFRTIAAKRIN